MPLPAALVATLPAAVSAVGGLFGQLFRNRSERREYERMRRYNTPAAQMQRFREAGLSPYLAYGQASSGNMTSPAPAQESGAEHLGQIGSNALANYMAYANFDRDMRMKNQQLTNIGFQNSILFNKDRIEFINAQRKMGELYADFPQMIESFDNAITPEVVTGSFRMKMNELKRAAAKATLDRIQIGIENMNYRNAVDRVKARYATDYGMVGGDWTQGLGLLKSLPSLFKRSGRAVNPQHKELIRSYEKFKGDQYKRNANRFLFEQLKP